MGFDFNPDVPQTSQATGGQQRTSNIDYDAMQAYQLEKLGGEGKHDLIGVITNIYEVGVQELDEQVVPWTDAEKDHAWRFEKREDGEQKDQTARLEMRKRKGKDVECLVYQQNPVAQAVITVDFPEVSMDLGQFFSEDGSGGEEKPFRAIIGENGFVPRNKWGKNVIAKPFNLRHTNVNRQKEGAAAHYAFAKNSLIHDLAEWAGVLDENGNFHITELGKLILKPMNFEVEVKVETWDKTDGGKGSKLVVNTTPVSKLSKRDQDYFDKDLSGVVTEDLCGVLQFSGGNSEETIKTCRKSVFNTMQFATNWEGSKLKDEFAKIKPEWFGYGGPQQSTGSSQGNSSDVGKQSPSDEPKPSQIEPKQPAQQFNELPMDFEDDQ